MKERIRKALSGMYGEREAGNIAAYYTDAMRGIDIKDFEGDLDRLISGVPVQYVCQSAYFYGIWFYVNEHVLIPRPETEELVHWILSEVSYSMPYRVLDIGSGSGCIILSLLSKLKSAKGTALEIDAGACQVISGNADNLGIDLDIIEANILDEDLDEEIFYDIMVSNPPYILPEERSRMDNNVLGYEPAKALFVEGDDPLVFYKRIIGQAEKQCAKGGKLYMETSDLYHEELKEILETKAYHFEFRKDLQDKWRMLKIEFSRPRLF
ncbi:MAG: peptide chain release factor N(5)-glutamine methyltransferase [Bacteroidia bacterium]|nr:peptide chain release factor N(5)-glutamine methyltransferase [Bacteroidia bacterium]NNK89177.1 peptide chain release factor N(5)-glutamine methyltransferase [Saprospiraceae bacterium]